MGAFPALLRNPEVSMSPIRVKLQPLSLSLVLTLAIAACNESPPPQTEAPTEPEVAASPAPTEAANLQPKVELGTIQSLQQGDRACYVSVMDGSGNISEQFANFELCQQTELVGQSARLFYEPQPIQAASCQGDPECTDSETVLLLVRAESTEPVAQAPAPTPAPTPAPAPPPAAPAPAPAQSSGGAEYMGIAVTGEEVYYNGTTLQCGDLPYSDPCWTRPNVSYTIGSDEVFGVVDCQRQVFAEAWVGGELVAQDMAPQSEAIAAVLSRACFEVMD
jgi:hypothetical protein